MKQNPGLPLHIDVNLFFEGRFCFRWLTAKRGIPLYPARPFCPRIIWSAENTPLRRGNAAVSRYIIVRVEWANVPHIGVWKSMGGVGRAFPVC